MDDGSNKSVLRLQDLPADLYDLISDESQSHPDIIHTTCDIKSCNLIKKSKCAVIRVKLNLHNWSGEHQFIVSDNINVNILGHDFLKTYKVIVDHANNKL